mgnify:CR=1 FL=1|tara:strand:- start:1640 stop:2221 length:582 start_codon:yes stop_codon:yes gene_type:complete
MQKKNIFPTIVYIDRFSLDDDKLLNSIIELKEKNPNGMSRSNAGNSYHSIDNIHTLPNFKNLCDCIIKFTQEICEEQKIKNMFYIGNMWANINSRGGFNDVHTHGNAFLSGVYYVKVPKNSGNLRFTDPRPQSNLIVPQREGETDMDHWNQIEFNGEIGQVLIFPAYVPHQVLINHSEDMRISISFNIALDWS